MSRHGDAAVDLFSARAAASRANGAKSRGPRTAEGKARASQNALKHGMCAKKFLLLPYDSRAEFAALESALLEQLCPEGAIETLLARRLIAAAWRLARADRLEFEMLVGGDQRRTPGGALTRDGGAERAFATLVRYRNGAQAEFFRMLKALNVQAPAAGADPARGRAIDAVPRPPAAPSPMPFSREAASGEAEPRASVRTGDADAPRNEPERTAIGRRCATEATRNEPELRARPLHGAAGEHAGRAGAALTAAGFGWIERAAPPQRVDMNFENRSRARSRVGRAGGEAEAQVALAAVAERRARGEADAGRGQQVLGEGQAVATGHRPA